MCRSRGGFRPSTPHMRDQQRQRGRRHAVDPPRLPDRSRPDGLQLLAHFHGERRHRRIVEIVPQLYAFVAPVGRHVGGLAIEINRVLGIDLDLLRDVFRYPRELRPNPDCVRHSDVRVRQHIDRAAPLPVFLQRQPVAFGLVGRDG